MGKEDGLAPGEYGTFIWKGNGTKKECEGVLELDVPSSICSLWFLDFSAL